MAEAPQVREVMGGAGIRRLHEMAAAQFALENPDFKIRGLCKVESVMAPQIAVAEGDPEKQRKIELDSLSDSQVQRREKEYAMREIATGEQYTWNRYMLCNMKMEEIPLSEAKPEIQELAGYKPPKVAGRRS